VPGIIVHEASTRTGAPLLAPGGLANDSPMTHRKAAFGTPRNFLGNRFVYVVISERAHGLSVGVNMNPDKLCDYDCIYCEVDRRTPSTEGRLNVELMAEELERTLSLIARDELRAHPPYTALDPELRRLRHVTLSGDGEPTLCPQFREALQAVAHVRALGAVPFFKLVLLTNGSGLVRPEVQEGLKLLTRQDEVWMKLDGGTQTYLNRINRGQVSLGHTLQNILNLARQRPVVIQSLFPALDGQEPPSEEIEQYASRLKELKEHGAQISLVQIYSCIRPTFQAECTHLPLKSLSRIAQRVREVSGLTAEVF
jgi:wyosine [tRNA(Phe)-imidazoG37] synthetase (radical SAM superfamily)